MRLPSVLAFQVRHAVFQVVIIVRGIESIRIAEKASAPVLIGLSAAVLIWAVRTAGGWGPMLSEVPTDQAAGHAGTIASLHA